MSISLINAGIPISPFPPTGGPASVSYDTAAPVPMQLYYISGQSSTLTVSEIGSVLHCYPSEIIIPGDVQYAGTIYLNGVAVATNALYDWTPIDGSTITLTSTDVYIVEPVTPTGYILSYSTEHGTAPSPVSDVTTLTSALLPKLSTKGWAFDGWYYESTFTTQAQAGDTLSADTTLYAKWSVKTYPYYYHKNDGTAEYVSQTKTHGTPVTLYGAGTFTREGYILKEWNEEPDGSGLAWQLGAICKVEGRFDLYAVWEKDGYTVSYQTDYGTTPQSVNNVRELDSETLPTLTDAAYEFWWWSYVRGDAESKANVGDVITQDTTLYAIWSLKNYHIRYYSNGGTGTIPSTTKMHGSPVTLSDGTGFSKEGYTLKEWNTEPNGMGTTYALGGSYSDNADLILYAVWEEHTSSTLDVTYGGAKIIDSLEVTPPVPITYNGSTIATLNEGDTKTLQCNGKVMASDVVIGNKTLQCNGKLMASDVIVEVKGGVTIPELPPESEWVNNTFTINEGETYQISDVSAYSFNAGYQIGAMNNATLILKNASQQNAQVFFDRIAPLEDSPLNIVVDTGTAYIQIISPSNYDSFWYSNLTFKTGSNVAINDYSIIGSQFYGNIVCEEGSVLTFSLDNGAITGNIMANGTLTINGGTITGDITANGTLTINGGTITGNIMANGTLTINGGTITGDITATSSAIGIYLYGGIIDSAYCCLALDEDFAGELVIGDPTFKSPEYIFNRVYDTRHMLTGGIFYFTRYDEGYVNQEAFDILTSWLMPGYRIEQKTDSEGKTYFEVSDSPPPVTGETWVINGGTVTALPDFTVDFVSNGFSCSRIWTDGKPLPRYLIYTGPDASIVAFIIMEPDGGIGVDWRDQAYRTITLDSPATGDFLNWLQANAVKQ